MQKETTESIQSLLLTPTQLDALMEVVNVIIPFTLVDYAKSKGIKDVQGFFVMYIDHCIGVEQGYSVDVLRDYFKKESNQEIIEDFS